jgi:hypothetical protein
MTGMRTRLVILGRIGVFLCAWSAYGAFLPSQYGGHWSIYWPDSHIRFVTGLLSVGAMLVAFSRAPLSARASSVWRRPARASSLRLWPDA